MSLLDDNFDVDNDALYKECIKYMLDKNNYLFPHNQSLWKEINVDYRRIQITSPSHVPEYCLIGYNFNGLFYDVDILNIRLFDPDLISINKDNITYKDDKGEYIYNFDKGYLKGFFGDYRLCTHLIYHNGGTQYGFLVIPTKNIINKSITEKYFIHLPVTSMEHYIMYLHNKSIDFHKTEEVNIIR